MMAFDMLDFPYNSQRAVTIAKKGMVATSQPLAAQAGLQILQKGGNAIDAAIATAACLTVVEPTSNGIGGDAFALIWSKGGLTGLNASGYSPQNISIDKVRERGFEEMPAAGWVPVTVPGIPSAWAELSRKHGQLSLETVMQPAIDYAVNGYPISPILGMYWGLAFKKYKKLLKGPEYTEWFNVFAPAGRAPVIGEIWSSPAHARTLQQIAETAGKSFYQGVLAEKIDEFSRKYQGFLRGEDLANYQAQWVKPISINYRGYDVWEIPPNGQGLIALLALNILKGFEFKGKESIETYHQQIEALKLAFVDGQEYITDLDQMSVQVADLLSDSYAAERRKVISQEASLPTAGTPTKGGTVYLATADAEGNMVSYIQSNYMGFGSGLVVPDTGIALQNRGHSFSLDDQMDNSLKPLKKPYHTIIPGFLSRNGEAVGPFGVMGGFMQPQGHLQVLTNMIDFNLNPQAALDAPRWYWEKERSIVVEDDFPVNLSRALARRGHDIKIALNPGLFGRGQIIVRNPQNGVLMGGTEKRTDGTVAAW